MAKETIDILIEGGKASAAPPLGPALGPMGVNIGQVVGDINSKTADFKGMKVPVKVIVDTETKEFKIEIGTPPASQLIKKELGISKASGKPNTEFVADMTIEQVKKVARMKSSNLLAKNIKNAAKEIMGTCNAMGIKVEGMKAVDAIAKVNSGAFDDRLKD